MRRDEEACLSKGGIGRAKGASGGPPCRGSPGAFFLAILLDKIYSFFKTDAGPKPTDDSTMNTASTLDNLSQVPICEHCTVRASVVTSFRARE